MILYSIIRQEKLGEFDDGYSNQTSGSFNQWFARDLDIRKLKELRNLETPSGYHASWNWWGPDNWEVEFMKNLHSGIILTLIWKDMKLYIKG
jgi:hypothetical protein